MQSPLMQMYTHIQLLHAKHMLKEKGIKVMYLLILLVLIILKKKKKEPTTGANLTQ